MRWPCGCPMRACDVLKCAGCAHENQARTGCTRSSTRASAAVARVGRRRRRPREASPARHGVTPVHVEKSMGDPTRGSAGPPWRGQGWGSGARRTCRRRWASPRPRPRPSARRAHISKGVASLGHRKWAYATRPYGLRDTEIGLRDKLAYAEIGLRDTPVSPPPPPRSPCLRGPSPPLTSREAPKSTPTPPRRRAGEQQLHPNRAPHLFASLRGG